VNMRCRNLRLFSLFGLSLIAFFIFLSCGCGSLSHNSSQPAQAPLALSYAVETAVYTQGMAIMANSPTITGGAVTSYSATPPLPAGIILNTSTGVISGTAIKATATTIYPTPSGFRSRRMSRPAPVGHRLPIRKTGLRSGHML
jgi:hypothetical protein